LSSKSIDLDKAAAIENDETMIISSDLTIITTPVESPQTSDEADGKKSSGTGHAESDYTPTSDESPSEPKVVGDKTKKRYKARSDSTRSAKYDNKILLFLCFYDFQLINLLLSVFLN
jgi:hypothetical protein